MPIDGLGDHNEIIHVQAMNFVRPPRNGYFSPFRQQGRVMIMRFGQLADAIGNSNVWKNATKSFQPLAHIPYV
jgi:hypothetical protein